MPLSKLALARVNYSQLYTVFDGGKTYKQRDVLTPYHLLNLAGYVRERAPAEVRIIDGEIGLLDDQALARRILDWQPRVVGLTATTPDIDIAVEVCRLLKAADASIVTVMGGIHATVCPRDVVARGVVDYVVRGDGEAALCDIVQRHGSGSEDPPASPQILDPGRIDLTDQPMPAHDLLDYGDYCFTDPTRGRYKTATVMSTRGCPFECTFCYHDRRVRLRRPAEFVDEVEWLYRRQDVRYFFVYDDVFLLDKSRVLDILARIRELRLGDVHFQCQTRANLVDPEVVVALCETGFVRASMGIESGSQAILDRSHKGIRMDDCKEACRVLARGGLQPRASFIIGHPYETHETVRSTIAFAKALDLLEANFTVMTPYPGTAVYDMALRGEGIHFTRPEYATTWSVYRRWGQPIVKTDELSADELARLREAAVTEFFTQDKVFGFYRDMYKRGNRSRYFFRPLNFAWQHKHGRDIPFWDDLDAAEFVEPA